jgi:hypothetical protein
MNDFERRLRAAMHGAAEQWSDEQRSAEQRTGQQMSASLLSGIRRRHRRHVRRLGAGCVAVAAAIVVAVPPVTHTLWVGSGQAGHGPAGRVVAPGTTSPGSATPTASPAPSPTTAPGTVLRGCDSANWGSLPSNWRAGSLEAGPVWFVYDRPHGYVREGGSYSKASAIHTGGAPRVGVMIVEVAFGATAVIEVDRASQPYFRLLSGFYRGGGSYSLRDGVTGLTLASCPRGTPAGPNGLVTDYYLGFMLLPGDRALVHLRSAGTRPIRLVFTCQVRGCGT